MPVIIKKKSTCVTIVQRRKFAHAAIRAFQSRTGTDDYDAVGDLVADLMHWADGNGQNALHEVSRGIRHWYAEKHDEKLPSEFVLKVE